MIKLKPIIATLIFISVAPVVAANSLYKVEGHKQVQINVHSHLESLASATAMSAVPAKKTVSLMRVKLSKAGKKLISDKANYELKQTASVNSKFEAQSDETEGLSETKETTIDLGMNGVPVLDQGEHGACVTFATTAALDAAYSQGDYISQLCNLSLGKYLESQDSEYPSGWDGSLNEIVLTQIQKYGVVSKSSQRKYGCAGVSDYPANNESDTGQPMSVEDFSKVSENIMANIAAEPVMQIEDSENGHAESAIALQKVKNEVSNGHRITIAVMLSDINKIGAVGKYHVQNDTWVLTTEIAREALEEKIDSGHALVITGYNDHVFITDADGNMHKGILYLRNSWGYDAGNMGEYYMTYDYFKAFTIEAYSFVRHH